MVPHNGLDKAKDDECSLDCETIVFIGSSTDCSSQESQNLRETNRCSGNGDHGRNSVRDTCGQACVERRRTDGCRTGNVGEGGSAGDHVKCDPSQLLAESGGCFFPPHPSWVRGYAHCGAAAREAWDNACRTRGASLRIGINPGDER